MALRADPPALYFEGTFQTAVMKTLKLINTTEKRLAFKLLAISPLYFNVSQWKGFIEPHDHKIIDVRLVAIADPNVVAGLGEFNPYKQKFLVQAAFTKDKSDDNQKALKILQQTPKNQIIELNVPCILLDATMPTEIEDDQPPEEHYEDEPMPCTKAADVPKFNESSSSSFSSSEPIPQLPKSDPSSDPNCSQGSSQDSISTQKTQGFKVSDSDDSFPGYGTFNYTPPSLLYKPACKLVKTTKETARATRQGSRRNTAPSELDELLNSSTFLLIMFGLLMILIILDSFLK